MYQIPYANVFPKHFLVTASFTETKREKSKNVSGFSKLDFFLSWKDKAIFFNKLMINFHTNLVISIITLQIINFEYFRKPWKINFALILIFLSFILNYRILKKIHDLKLRMEMSHMSEKNVNCVENKVGWRTDIYLQTQIKIVNNKSIKVFFIYLMTLLCASYWNDQKTVSSLDGWHS